MKILVVNCGSSSLKYCLFSMENEKILARGNVERIGSDGTFIVHQAHDREKCKTLIKAPDHTTAMEIVVNYLVDEEYGVLNDIHEIAAVGHRIVHGGEKFTKATLVTDEVIKEIEKCSDLAPLHNPAHVAGIRACKKLLPDVPMVVEFDTAFHQTIPRHAFLYALPYDLYVRYGIRRYGFHGTSHRYVSQRAAEIYGKPIENLNIITCHLGNGSSVTAIKNGKAIDTSMGLTPLEGLIMGTRSGDIDPTVVTFLMDKEGLSSHEVVQGLLNKRSGVLGISGLSHDFRDLQEAAQKGSDRAKLALEMFTYRLQKYIGAYATIMGGLDILVFTAGIGENSAEIRKNVCNGLSLLGIILDDELNNSAVGKEMKISSPESKTVVFVIPTNEELVIARDTKKIVEQQLLNNNCIKP